MTKQEQTDAVKVKLFNLTSTFVYKHQSHYYKQFRGDIEDLILDIYCEFLTPKARVKGCEKSLLDRYSLDDKPAQLTEETYFANLVKVSVIRKLIDKSRKDKYKFSSLDFFSEEYGDYLTNVLGLVDTPTDDVSFTKEFIETCRTKFVKLKPKRQQEVIERYISIRPKVESRYKKLFDRIIPLDKVDEDDLDIYLEVNCAGQLKQCFCQQLTSKSVCLYIENNVYDFDRVSGFCRNKDKLRWSLSQLTKDLLVGVQPFKSRFSRAEAILYFSNRAVSLI